MDKCESDVNLSCLVRAMEAAWKGRYVKEERDVFSENSSPTETLSVPSLPSAAGMSMHRVDSFQTLTRSPPLTCQGSDSQFLLRTVTSHQAAETFVLELLKWRTGPWKLCFS